MNKVLTCAILVIAMQLTNTARCAAISAKEPAAFEKAAIDWLKEVAFTGKRISESSDGEKGTGVDYAAWIESGRKKNIGRVLGDLFRRKDSKVALPQVAYALGFLGSRENVTALIDALASDDAPLRAEAAAALGRLGDLKATAPLCGLLSKDLDETVRANAADALGLLADTKAAESLKTALSDKSKAVASHAKDALEKLSEKKVAVKPDENAKEKQPGSEKQ